MVKLLYMPTCSISSALPFTVKLVKYMLEDIRII